MRGRRPKETYRVSGPTDVRFNKYGHRVGRDRANPWRVIFVGPGGPEGKGSRDCKYYASKTDADEAVTGYLDEAAQLSGLTVSMAIEIYLDDCRGRQLAKRTIEHYGLVLRSIFAARDLLLRAFTPEVAGEIFWGKRDPLGRIVSPGWASEMKGDGEPRSKWTQGEWLTVIKTFFHFLLERKIVKENPFAGLRVKGRPRPARPQLTRDEAAKFLVVAMALAEKGQPAGVAAAMCLVLGMRLGEVINLRCCDVDEGGAAVHVRVQEEPRPWKPKTPDSCRLLKVPAQLVPLMRRQHGDRLGLAALFPGYGVDTFRSKSWLYAWVLKICDLAEVSRVTPHGLRGTHGSLARKHGATSEMVMAQFGHAEPSLQDRHYVQPEARATATQDAFDRAVREAVERLNYGSITDPPAVREGDDKQKPQ